MARPSRRPLRIGGLATWIPGRRLSAEAEELRNRHGDGPFRVAVIAVNEHRHGARRKVAAHALLRVPGSDELMEVNVKYLTEVRE